MYKRIVILMAFLIMGRVGVSQQQLSMVGVNDKTYALYQKQDWKELVVFGNEALKKGFDFYYLRLRLGIAYYNMKKYRQAIPHFHSLYKTHPKDALVCEYLYFSYLLGGSVLDARKLSINLPPKVLQRYNIGKLSFFKGVYAEFKGEFLDDYQEKSGSGELIYQTVREKLSHYSMGLEHGLGPSATLFHAYSRVELDNRIISGEDENLETVTQNQYYIKSNFRVGLGTGISAALHFVGTKVEDWQSVQVPNSSSGNGRATRLSMSETSSNSLIGYLGISREISLFQVKLGMAYSNLGDVDRWQHEASLIFYPLGNSNLYLKGMFVHQSEKLNSDRKHRQFWKSQVGFKLGKSTWVQPGFCVGDMYYHVENEGYTVFNGINVVKNRKEVMLTHTLFKGRLALMVLWQTQKEESLLWRNEVSENKDININSLTGGVKWNF